MFMSSSFSAVSANGSGGGSGGDLVSGGLLGGVGCVPAPTATIREGSSRCSCLFDCFLSFTRIWGVFAAIVLFGVGVDTAFHRYTTGFYLIAASIVVLWLEITWAVTLFLQLCIRNEFSPVWKCWDCVRWVEGWKKTVIYGALGAVPIVWPHNLWLSYAAAGQLISLALFHFLLSFKGRRRRRRKNRLLGHADIDSYESSKFEEVTEVLDDGLPEPIPGSSHSLSDCLAEQDTILEI